MLVISGTIQIKPEMRDEAVQVAVKMQTASQAEDGCVVYRFYADLEDPNTFRIFEHWESDAALKSHFETPHMAEFRQHLPRLVADRGDLLRYEVSNVAKL
ncbi:MAG: putative quinol monooxygenase [Aggregatilineales bacterium]